MNAFKFTDSPVRSFVADSAVGWEEVAGAQAGNPAEVAEPADVGGIWRNSAGFPSGDAGLGDTQFFGE